MEFRYFGLFCSFLILSQIAFVLGQIKMHKGSPNVLISNPRQLLLGTVQTSRNNRPFYSFMGVRYANPPKRFEISEPLSEPNPEEFKWEAHKYRSDCAKYKKIWKRIQGSEDCLFLNVFVPMKDVAESLPLPVMIFIHGGAFTDGESETMGPEYLMDQNVILITINYRLGILGFLTTGDSVIPGNMGLHDQSLAIKWVYDNIEHFGGDKNRITIFGESAGAASVGLQLLYPKNAGLIAGAISQSGTIHCPWVMQNPKNMKANLISVSNFVGCGDKKNSSKELIECLRTKKWEDLIQGQLQIPKWFPGSAIPFGPVVEIYHSELSFLTESPEYLMEIGKFINVPHIIGINEAEGHLIYSAIILQSQQLTEELNNEWNRIAPSTFLYEHNLKDASNLDLVSEKLRNFYFGHKEINEDSRKELTDIYSDVYFNYGSQKTAKIIANHGGKVFTYVFKFKGDHTVLKSWSGIEGLRVVTHADELQYLFKSIKFGPKDGFLKDSVEERISKYMVRLWVSFAEERIPRNTWGKEHNWLPLSNNNNDIFWYELDSDTTINNSFEKDRHEFWDQLLLEYFVDKSTKSSSSTNKEEL